MYQQVYTFLLKFPVCFVNIFLGKSNICMTVGLTDRKLGVPDFLYIAIHQMSAKTFIGKRFYCRHFLMMLL